MKKSLKSSIALALIVLAVSSVSAEIRIKEQARIRTSAYSVSKTEGGDKKAVLWNLKNASAIDYLNFYADNEYAGVAIESAINAGLKNGADAITFDTYYGWLNYGALKFTFGDYDSRFTNRYNVTATEAGLLDSDIAKYGLSNKISYGLAADKTGKTWLYDFGNVAQPAGGENLSLIADYTLSDIAGGKLLLKTGLLDSEYDKGTEFEQNAGYVFEAAWQGESASLDLIFKNPVNKAFGGAAYLTYKPSDALAAVAGFTAGVETDVIDLAFAVDGRLQYAFSKELKATAVAKYSSYKADGADDAESALEAGAELSYAASDSLVFALDARLDLTDLDDNEGKDLGENTVTVSPRVKISAGPAAAITAAVEFTQALNSGDNDAAVKTKVDVPVIFRVKL
ncbi:MAG: hypothetical protein K6B73_02915 [Treponema sp.]|nr:hypothetical protein [Treponema sp.]